MRYQNCDLGVSTADADKVAIHFDCGDLRLSFNDWQDQCRTVVFRDVLAFRWQELDDPVPRDDATFEAIESTWLDHQARLQSVSPEQFRHYVLCFNGCGALDVLASQVSAD